MLCKRGLCRHAVSVCVCVCLSVTFVSSIQTNKCIIKYFHHRVATPFWFFLAKWHSKIPTETPLTGASNAGGVGRNRDSEPVSGFCLLLTLPQARVVNTVAGGPQPPHGKLSVTHRW